MKSKSKREMKKEMTKKREMKKEMTMKREMNWKRKRNEC